MNYIPIILASSSHARLDLLKQIGILPDYVIPADIDETPLQRELPRDLALRLAKQKSMKILSSIDHDGLIIAADTVVTTGREILPKALNKEDIEYCIKTLSNRRHRVYTGVSIIKKYAHNTIASSRIVTTIVKFRYISDHEIQKYVSLEEGINKAGGYSIRGYAESFVSFLSGSYSNIVGLPLTEVIHVINGMGFNIKSGM
jgi:septum formation protein